MSDLYSELLVKKEATSKDAVVKYGMIVLTVLAAFAGLFMNPLLLIVAVALGVACYFVIPRTDLEYEYLFVNGEFDIDMVMAKSKRKKVMSMNLSEADLVAPLDSQRMAYYNGNDRMKTLDYSSGNPDHKRFAVIIKSGGENRRVIIEPDEQMAQAIKNSAPSKVFLD
ncbi:DUF6106 family protein [Blautia sp. MSJ-19]|uniref:DUF6106 family protein n=1 Tax=Blautia sp. MSJ-19 TaxID=2841517 RepID=UPI001C0EFBFF|nr:DUF6106 family protein [Blautia sp. MSJ-19]MBU5480655.1 PRA1 family protein [Blautia sp. MSJ-19]